MILSPAPRAELAVTAPFVADILDPARQEIFSRPISSPIDYGNLAWDYGQDIDVDSLPDHLHHLIPILDTVVAVGDLAPRSRSEFLMALIKQGPADSFNGRSFSWHKDDFHEDFRRVVLSDKFGTRYRAEDGSECPTPDYGLLVIDENTDHAVHEAPDSSIRTSMLVSRFAIQAKGWFGTSYYDPRFSLDF